MTPADTFTSDFNRIAADLRAEHPLPLRPPVYAEDESLDPFGEPDEYAGGYGHWPVGYRRPM